MLFSIIDRYLVKTFLYKLIQVFVAFSLLGFVINLIENLKKYQNSNIYDTLLLSLCNTPKFVDQIISSIFFIAGIVSFFNLAKKSEIIAIRGFGISFARMISPIAVITAILGGLWITAGVEIISISNKQAKIIEKSIKQKKDPQKLNPTENFSQPLWFRQNFTNCNSYKIYHEAPQKINLPRGNLPRDNLPCNHYAIFSAEAVDISKKTKDSSPIFYNINIFFFNEEQQFTTKITADSMMLKQGFWELSKVNLYNASQLNQKLSQVKIISSFAVGFVEDLAVNSLNEANLFNIFQLPQEIKSRQQLGINNLPFKALYYHLLAKPIMLVALIILSLFFAVHHFRSRKAALMVVLGLACGLLIYILDLIFLSLISADVMSIFSGIWVSVALYFSLAILLLFTKEHS